MIRSPEHGDVAVKAIVEDSSLRLRTLSQVKDRRTQGRPLDAQAYLSDRPELAEHKSVVLDLAYEEYCQRVEAGESIDADDFCDRFQPFERSLRRLIEIHDFLEEHSFGLPGLSVEWPEPGQTFHGFSVLAEIGRGAFARVFLANEIALGNRLVAIKVSLDGAAEAEMLGRLRHANIVPVYSVGQHEETGLTVVCMPYLGRVTLSDVLGRLFAGRERPARSRSILEAIRVEADLSYSADEPARQTDTRLARGSYVDGAIHLGTQLAEALAYSHSQGICHSDLKPSNVMMTPAGRPMLLDFNLAFDVRAMRRRLGGSLPYMAPEQLRALEDTEDREPPTADERSDVFSLGVVLYEVLAGRLPFGPILANRSRDQLTRDLLKRHESGPIDLREVNPEVNPFLADLVNSCLAYDPAVRPQSARELAAALRRSRSPAQKARHWARRHTSVVLSVVAGLLLVCAGAAYHLLNRDPYSIRMMQEGLSSHRQGDYPEAEACLRAAINAPLPDEMVPDALLLRGRALMELKRFDEAMWDFVRAGTMRPNGETFACEAYAAALAGVSSKCVRSCRKAIDAGFATAEVYNNLGFGYLSLGEFRLALGALGEAIQLDSQLGRAFHNRAVAEYRCALNEGRRIDPQAGADIEQAIRIGPETAYLCHDAALVYGQLDKDWGGYRDKTVKHVCRAIRLGADPQTVRANFSSFLDEPEVKTAFGVDVPVSRRSKSDYLADPHANGFSASSD
ncbi:MAG: protein kinase domain-containing protein [Planctomycetota bacterium]|jgi:serine/threonine protein kinase